MKRPLLVIKFGTASITLENGEPDILAIEQIAKEIALLNKQYRVVMVSSGAVGAGKHFIQNYLGQIAQRKAAAAVGNPILINLYASAFAKYQIHIAQSLCERGHFANRRQFLQLKETYEELWRNDIIPIANENDVVSNRELKFSDNDELATLLAVGFNAHKLLICTSVGGFLDTDKKVIPRVEIIDDAVMQLVDSSKSALGLGGMASKLTFARMATKMGIEVVIFGMKNGIISALEGGSGTLFSASESTISSRNKWLASGGLSVAKIIIDGGAVKALQKRNSLLAVGIKKIVGDFGHGEVIEIVSTQGNTIAVAKVKVEANELRNNLKTNNLEVANAHDIVLM